MASAVRDSQVSRMNRHTAAVGNVWISKTSEPSLNCHRGDPRSRPRLVPKRGHVNEVIDLKKLLRHKQVSHVLTAPPEVKRHMDSYRGCVASRVALDLRGKSASQVQRDLRKQLVHDLAAGVDDAAFVCSQVGIDLAPRCDQLELMIAAMPGLLQIEFDGPAAKSYINVGL